MFKKILCPFDGSDTSTKGLNEAIKLAKSCQAKLRILHIVDCFYPFLDGIELTNFNQVLEAMRERGKSILEQAKNLAQKEGLEVEIELTETMSNKVADAIVNQAKTWQADLIVIGTHGHRGINHFLLGSDAEAVVRNSSVPVLTVKLTE
ncbi:MAG TPA: universal stress protein [Methylophilaceae bacterium]|jgi:nucleotide-binding universal stress UspA family protein